MPHIPSRSSAVNDPFDLPLAVFGRAKSPALQFRCQTRENFVIRPALGLQYAVAPADKLFRTLVQEREHFVDETHRLRTAETAGTNQISDELVELGRLRHEPTVRYWRSNSKRFARIRAIISVAATPSGEWPRLWTSIVRSNVITTVPFWLQPRVSIVTMPWPGRVFDSRLARVLLSA